MLRRTAVDHAVDSAQNRTPSLVVVNDDDAGIGQVFRLDLPTTSRRGMHNYDIYVHDHNIIYIWHNSNYSYKYNVHLLH